MASEIRVNSITNRSGLTTTTWNDQGIVVTGIVTATKFSGPFDSLTAGSVNVSGDATISGNLGVAGTVTYEDVARVDATGISTFREGFHLGPLAGVGLTAYKDGSIRTSGIITAASFVGDGSGLTGAGPTLANGADNRIVTATGANAITGESGLTFDGSTLNFTAASGDARLSLFGTEGNDARITLCADEGDDHIDQWNLRAEAANHFVIDQFSGGTFVERLRIGTEADNGDVTVKTGNLIMGTSGKGINFAANTDGGGTSSSTVLDDYEEGSYSTSMVSSNCTLDNSSGTGYYIKVGNMVHVRGTFSLNTNDGSPSVSGSDSIVQALPFTRASNGTFTGTMLQQNINWGGPTSLAHPHYFNPVASGYVCMVASDGIRFYMNKVEYAFERLNNSHLHVGYPGYTSILWSITYQTT